MMKRLTLPCLLLVMASSVALSCSDTPGATDAGTDGLGITALEVEANSTSVLSCFLKWKTQIPSSSVVEFGKSESFTFRISDPTLTTDHKVLVISMHADTDYYLRAISDNAQDGRMVSKTVKHHTQKLPAYLPLGTITVHDKQRAQDGWTLMTVTAAQRIGMDLNIVPDKDFPPTAVLYDMEGRPVWYNAHGLGRVGDARFVDNHVLVQSMANIFDLKLVAMEIDLAGKTVWEGPKQPLWSVHGHYHHHFEKLSNGNYFGVKSTIWSQVIGDTIVEMDKDHKIVWSWSTWAHMRPDLTLWDHQDTSYAWTHINAMNMNLDQGFLIVNARNLSTILKIDKKTGEILWRFGKGGDFVLKDTQDKYPWFELAHGVVVLPNNNLLMYDNGPSTRGFSRAVEYSLDEATMTAKLVWQYGGGDERFFTNYWGDADRQPNSNTTITIGSWKIGQPSRVIEVTPNKEKVWEMVLPIRKSTGTTVGMYNSQRITPPLIEKIYN